MLSVNMIEQFVKRQRRSVKSSYLWRLAVDPMIAGLTAPSKTRKFYYYREKEIYVTEDNFRRIPATKFPLNSF